ncbi:aspartate/glutamate racemase family protein [Jannaschia aquimarina]|uniref:Aspartate racemase n=1 Tax=Jannaschia aquimarina TaxID=935700 RepID=A0A0D1EPZ0_9RHOB|nr:amino acid racemase [Jannaschia aquimarina]KIT17690.1 Aspartate racemase [Jannaschia aquimarina]SNS78965.1 aspartate racemase [Jannaschia aquimarina]
MNFGNIEALLRADDWDGLTAYMDDHVAKLAAAGVDLLIGVSNTLHRILPELAGRHGLRLIHTADPTGEAIRSAGLDRIALFGTRPVMELDYLADHYRSRHGIDIVTPNDAEKAEIDRIIFEELCRFDVRETSRTTYLDIADRLVREQGAQGVILGCTEIFLLMRPEDRPDLPLFNTTELHCRAAVEAALA